MTAPARPPIDDVHDAATDAASESDRLWFATNPASGPRVRLPLPHELCLIYGACVSPTDVLIRVVEFVPGIRGRMILPAAEART
jgi:hypothetical protein